MADFWAGPHFFWAGFLGWATFFLGRIFGPDFLFFGPDFWAGPPLFWGRTFGPDIIFGRGGLGLGSGHVSEGAGGQSWTPIFEVGRTYGPGIIFGMVGISGLATRFGAGFLLVCVELNMAMHLFLMCLVTFYFRTRLDLLQHLSWRMVSNNRYMRMLPLSRPFQKQFRGLFFSNLFLGWRKKSVDFGPDNRY